MYTDLFLALLNRHNARGHPILSALLYTFCPMAANWWLAGADPIPPFDPVWKSLKDLASGGTLMDYLIRYGFDGLIEEIRTYIREVEEYRNSCRSFAEERFLQVAALDQGTQSTISAATGVICSFTFVPGHFFPRIGGSGCK